VYVASSKPYQRSPKKMWPLISPASGAFSSFIFALTSECPVFHITGSPPASRISGARRCEHLTSKRIGAPLTRFSTSRANSMSWRSGWMIVPSSVTTPSRSPSPSKASPSSARPERTAAITSARFSGLLGSGWWFGKLPSTSE
jgi:hypothetical protein